MNFGVLREWDVIWEKHIARRCGKNCPPCELTKYQLILSQSRTYGGVYTGDQLPAHRRIWPRETWLSKRLREIKEKEDVKGI